MRPLEREREKQAGRRHGDQETGDAPGNREHEALEQRLRDDLPSARAERQPQGDLSAARRGTGQEQVGDVGARDQEDQRADRQQDLQAAPVRLLHLADAAAGGHDVDHLPGQVLHETRDPVCRVPGAVLQPVPQRARKPRRDAFHRGAGAQSSDDAEPRRDRLAKQRAVAVDQGLLLDGQPEIRRIAAKRLAKEPRGRDADDRERMILYDERRADDRCVAAVLFLPGAVAQHRHRGRRRRVVGGREDATGERVDAERLEVVARHELGTQGLGRRGRAAAAHAHALAAGLERGHLVELGRLGFQPLEERVGVHAPAVLRSALDAAVVPVANAVQQRGIGDRQRPQHHGVDQREDRRRAADAEGQRGHGRDREHRRLPELAQHVPKVGQGLSHAGLVLELDESGATGVAQRAPSVRSRV